LRRPERSIQSNVQEALKRKLFSIIKGKGKEKSEGIEIISDRAYLYKDIIIEIISDRAYLYKDIITIVGFL